MLLSGTNEECPSLLFACNFSAHDCWDIVTIGTKFGSPCCFNFCFLTEFHKWKPIHLADKNGFVPLRGTLVLLSRREWCSAYVRVLEYIENINIYLKTQRSSFTYLRKTPCQDTQKCKTWMEIRSDIHINPDWYAIENVICCKTCILCWRFCFILSYVLQVSSLKKIDSSNP